MPSRTSAFYLGRAEELRAIAEDAMLDEIRRTLLSLADSYERMAEMVEDAFVRETGDIGQALHLR